jgi:hypothetical protein
VPVEKPAKQIGVSLLPALLDTPTQKRGYRSVFATSEQARADALVVGDSSVSLFTHGADRRIGRTWPPPDDFPECYVVESGGLMSTPRSIPVKHVRLHKIGLHRWRQRHFRREIELLAVLPDG